MSNWLIVFLFIISAYGLSNMMVFGSGPFKIFEHIRRLSNKVSDHFGLLFTCMMCFPANLGWVLSLIDWFLVKDVAFTPFNLFLQNTNLWWLAMILDCVFTSGIVWLIHNIETYFENNSLQDDNNEE